MSNTENLYETLGVEKKASAAEIKKAYRKLCKTHHPDVGGDEETFKKISHSYEVLSDPVKKDNYDKFGTEEPQRGNFNQEFRQHFNQYQQPERKGEDMVLSVKLSLEEIFNGVTKKYKYNRNVRCVSCEGHGGKGIVNCSACNGVGVIFRVFQTPIGEIRQMFPCHLCEGLGTNYQTQCTTCHGHGVTSKEETVEVKIPHGVQEGITFVMGGKGHGIKGGNYGNLNITIHEAPHKTFVRNGVDLRMKANLSYSQLVLGDKIDIETIEGTKIRVTIPEHSEVGIDLRIKNKGLKHFGNENRGDIIISLGINIPKTITDEGKELLLKLKDIIT